MCYELLLDCAHNFQQLVRESGGSFLRDPELGVGDLTPDKENFQERMADMLMEFSPGRRTSLGERRLSVDNEVNKENGLVMVKSPRRAPSSASLYKPSADDDLQMSFEDMQRRMLEAQSSYQTAMEANQKLLQKNDALNRDKAAMKADKETMSHEVHLSLSFSLPPTSPPSSHTHTHKLIYLLSH